ILLLIHPAGGDAHAFDAIADDLADRYTVVTYDRRGLSRSRLEDPEQTQRVETHADDAHRLLALLGNEPAYVLGTSGGAAGGPGRRGGGAGRARLPPGHGPAPGGPRAPGARRRRQAAARRPPGDLSARGGLLSPPEDRGAGQPGVRRPRAGRGAADRARRHEGSSGQRRVPVRS